MNYTIRNLIVNPCDQKAIDLHKGSVAFWLNNIMVYKDPKIRNEQGKFVKGHKSLSKKGYVFTAEQKKHMSEGHKGRIVSQETRQKMSIIAKKMGFGQWMKGKHLSDETKRKISEARKGSIPWNRGLTKETDSRLVRMSIIRKGSIPWNKGLNKEIDSRVARKKGFKHSKETRLKMSLANKGKKLSQKTKDKISEAHKKIIHTEEWNKNVVLSRKGKTFKWSEETKRRHRKNAKTSINKLIRCSKEFKEWRGLVFKRDDWTCQKTKKKGGILHPHHIKNFAQFPKLRFNVNNGITLSEKAHRKFHRIYGKKDNTKEQLLEFLKCK